MMTPTQVMHGWESKDYIVGGTAEETPSPDTHLSVGTFRPPFEQAFLSTKKDQFRCPVCCVDNIREEWARPQIHRCWMLGHFDLVVYTRRPKEPS